MKLPTTVRSTTHALLLTLLSLGLGACASTKVKKTWSSPELPGHRIQKVSVVAVADRGPIRLGFENRFVDSLERHGQPAIPTHSLVSLQDLKADKEAASSRLRGAGADAVLVLRLVNQSTHSSQMRATPELYAPTVTGYGTYGWHDYYAVAFTDLGVVWSNSTEDLYLDCGLFDLATGRRLWSATTLTALKEDADRLAVADELVAKVVGAMVKDGVIKKEEE